MIALEVRDSANYAASVVRIPTPFTLPNADRLVGLGIQGFTVITAKDGDIHEGDLAVFFPAEAQLSEKLTREANLYRHTDLNVDPTQSGYLEDNRRVRSLKLRGTVSNGLILPAAVVAKIFGLPAAESLAPGDIFDHIDGQEVCRKYRVKEPVAHASREDKRLKKAFKRIDEALFPEHIETDQYFRNEQYVDDEEILIVTQKLHGTSARFSRALVCNKLTWYERLAKRLGVRVQEHSFDLIAGSRHSIKDPNNPNLQHFYGTGGDVWTNKLAEVGDVIPQGVIIYGEIVGWLEDGGQIQQGHTYGQPEGTNELYVYRVSVMTDSGELFDLSWDQVRTFCNERGLKHVPELWRGFKKDFDPAAFEEKAFAAEQWKYKGLSPNPLYVDDPVPLSSDGTGADEGIAIRVERGARVPALFKVKNQSHFLYETAQLDAGELDLESAA